MRFSFSSPKKEIAVLADLGVASVGVALFERVAGKQPKMLWASRRQYDAPEEKQQQVLRATLEKQLEAVRTEADARGLRVECFSCALFPKFFTHYGERAKKVFDTPTVITEKLLGEVSDEVVYQHVAPGALLERKITSVRLNGYHVSQPFGLKARELEVDLSLGIPVPGILDTVVPVADRFFPGLSPEIHTVPFLAFMFLRDILGEGEDFVSILVGADSTEVSSVEEGSLARTFSFSYGHRTVVRRIQEVLRTIPEEAESVLRLFLEKKLAQDVEAIVAPLVAECYALWQKQCVEVFTRAATQALIPQKMCLIGDSQSLMLFKEPASLMDVSHMTRLAQPFSLHTINSQLLRSFISETPEARKSEDCFLLLEALALSRHNA